MLGFGEIGMFMIYNNYLGYIYIEYIYMLWIYVDYNKFNICIYDEDKFFFDFCFFLELYMLRFKLVYYGLVEYILLGIFN